MENEYLYFFEALKWNIANKWKRQQGALASDAGISNAFLSEIVNEKKNAGFETQVSISKACGYSYEEFLYLGRKLLNGETPDTPEKNSGINQSKKHVLKVGNGMEVTEKDAILRHCLEELAALRDEIKYLREERNHFRERTFELEKKLNPVPDEKKTAV